MRVRWAMLIVMLSGCGGGGSASMRFVENETLTKPLHRRARAELTKSLDEHFGTPLNSVAWLKLPVNFGRAEGKITAVDGTTLSVEFTGERTDLTGFDSAEFAHTELLFTGGPNAGKSIKLASFDGVTKSFEMESDELTPSAGDQFVVAGNVIKHGRKLYARHCQHCHGISGDGDGPTAKYLNPRPRDYRQGKFKFTSTKATDKATRDDLRRIVAQGIPGTYMPAFVPMLKDGELTAIVEYVRWLALRGEMERQLFTELNSEFPASRVAKEVADNKVSKNDADKQIVKQIDEYVKNDKEGLPAKLQEAVADVSERWVAVEEEGAAFVPPIRRTPDTAESRAEGRKLYFNNDGKCVNCHGEAGRGNGKQTEEFQAHPVTKELVKGIHDDWGLPLKPRDLTRGIYRGGRRPIDIYRRISEGIKGTPMPAGSKTLKPEQIWDLVNYVMSIPFESPAPKAEKSKNVATTNPAEQGESN